MIQRFLIVGFVMFLSLSVLAADATPEKFTIGILNNNWYGPVEVEKNGTVTRVQTGDKGKFKLLDKRTIEIDWDAYPPETFKKFGKLFFRFDKKVIDDLKQEYEQLAYTFQNPYVKVNPFNQNPLSAYVHFETPKAARVHVIVKGKDGSKDLVFNPTSYTKNHELCVPGLYPGHQNEVLITACDNKNVCESSKLKIGVNKLSIPTKDRVAYFTKNKTANDSPMTFLIRDKAMAFDENENIRWMMNFPKFIYPFKNVFALEEPSVGIKLFSPCGQLLDILAYPPDFKSFEHAIAEGKDGSFLAVGSKRLTKFNLDGQEVVTAYDHILEMDGQGKVIKYLDLGAVLPMNYFRAVKSLKPQLDSLHLNHVTYEPSDDSFIVSSKHLGFVKLEYETGQVKWVAGAHPTSEMLNRNGQVLRLPYLTAVDEKGVPYPEDVQNGTNEKHLFDWPIITHDAKASGSFYTVFSNNGPVYDRTLVTRPASSVLIYRIDETQKTIAEAARILLPEFAPIASNATYDEQTGIVHIFVSDIDDKNVAGQVYNKIYRLRLPPLKKGDKVKIFDVSGTACTPFETCLKPEVLYEADIQGSTYFYQGRPHDFTKMPVEVDLNK